MKRISSGDINNHIYHNSDKFLIPIFRILHISNHYSHFHLRVQRGSAFHLHYKSFTCKTKNWSTFSLYQPCLQKIKYSIRSVTSTQVIVYLFYVKISPSFFLSHAYLCSLMLFLPNSFQVIFMDFKVYTFLKSLPLSPLVKLHCILTLLLPGYTLQFLSCPSKVPIVANDTYQVRHTTPAKFLDALKSDLSHKSTKTVLLTLLWNS